MSLFSTLNTGYSGLSAAEVATATTGHNIANANNDFYTRQRVITSASTPFHTTPGDIGTGVRVTQIARIHDEYTYQRLKDSSNSLSYDNYSEQRLTEVAKHFPDLKNLGIANDLANYFNSWNDLSSNTNDGSQKVALVQNASTLATSITESRTTLRSLQDTINDELKSNIIEVNQMGEQIANLNKSIGNVESVNPNRANDLRDQRDKLELTLSKMLDVSAFKGQITSDNSIDPNMTDQGLNYHLNIAGNSFVDGSTFHPIVIDNSENASKYYSLYSEMQDGTRYDITGKIHGGKIGAMLDLRGRTIDKTTNGGYPSDGTMQGYVDDLDTFANTLIVQTNNIYAKSATLSKQSPIHENLKSNMSLTSSDLNVKSGTFDLVMYDNQGKEVGRKPITIDSATAMDGTAGSSIVEKINSQTDDNHDNNSTNDISDYFTAAYSTNGVFSITPTSAHASENYKISLEDNGTNFPGAIGIGQFFSGNDASNIKVKAEIKNDPSKMQGYKAPIDGNNDVANDMIQLQYDKIDFFKKDNSSVNDSLSGFYRFITANIATDGENATRHKDTSTALFNTVNSEFQSISGVNTDEELTNLMKFQTAYGANAKVITTIDQMLNTLLGIKA
ncbi:MAG: flagellar hook-associated protein FlgK [Epsilonproteobacteria bacterium]|nr:flagellar hook-associated protein FlgK [Campylobacterota bacterium]